MFCKLLLNLLINYDVLKELVYQDKNKKTKIKSNTEMPDLTTMSTLCNYTETRFDGASTMVWHFVGPSFR